MKVLISVNRHTQEEVLDGFKIHMENIVLISTMLRETDWKLSLSPHGSPRCSFASNAIRLGLLGSKTSLEGRMSGQTTQRLRTGGCSHGRGQNGTGVRTEQGSGPETRNPSVRARARSVRSPSFRFRFGMHFLHVRWSSRVALFGGQRTVI